MLQSAKDQLAQLAFNFKINSYRQLNESQTRLSYIDRFWEILGWNIRNTAEVQVETTDKKSKRPDYRFVKGKKTLFFVEAKKPAEDLKNPKHIYQTKLYCWNGNVPLAILTDFEEFRPFRSVGKPDEKNPNKGLIKNLDITFEQYADRVDDLFAAFGKEAVDAGSIATLVKATQAEIRDTVDKDFLNTITRWRLALADKIASSNHFENEFQLSESVQRILDRLVFLRIIQDKGIEDRDYLSQIAECRARDTYSEFVSVCKELAPKYNGLIFNPHPTSENLSVETTLFKRIVKEMMPEDSPYRFDEIPVEMLGTIYERFLGDEISFDKKGKISIDQKPEVRKAGGVYYTPQYIVEYIVENTVGKLLEKCKTPDDVAKLRILDPACGSGSFLLGAFDKLIAWHEDYFGANPHKAIENKKSQGFLLARLDAAERMRLTTRMKGRILQNNIFGVDLDKQATEVAQMSLYIRVLEGYAEEAQTSIGFKEAILPKMEGNIKCGNSLIGTDFIQDDFFGLSEREKHKINPFDWDEQFPTVFRRGDATSDQKAFHVTWATHESRKVNPNDRASEVILDGISREKVAKFIDDKIPEINCKVIEANVLNDHVHILLVCPSDELAEVVRNLKGYSSYMLHRNTEDSNLRVNPEVDAQQYSDGTIKKLWASGFDSREINENEYFENVQLYIRNNHAKHNMPPLEYSFKNLTSTTQAFAPASNAGFDAVIGNPPYINLKRGFITEIEKNYIEKHYRVASSQYDAFSVFIEKAISLINNNGFHSFIVPKPMIASESYEIVREVLLNYHIANLAECATPFEDAGVEAIVFAINKNHVNKTIHVCRLRSEGKSVEYCINQEIFCKLPYRNFSYLINNENSDLFFKVFTIENRLDSVYDSFTRGIEAGKSSSSINECNSENSFKLIRGEDLTRYATQYKNLYFEATVQNQKEWKNKQIYCSSNILIRRVADRIIASINNDSYWFLNTIYSLKTRDSINPFFILGLLNSKVLNYIFGIAFVFDDKLFPYLRISQLEQLPIPSSPPQDLHDRLVSLVERMLELHEKLKAATEFDRQHLEAYIARTDREIDGIVYKLYGLTDEEIRIVEGN